MPQYKHRGYSISISIKRFDDKVKVETEILLPPDVDDRDGDRSLAGGTDSVSVAALEDIHKEAFESAKRKIDCSLLSNPRRATRADEARRKMASTCAESHAARRVLDYALALVLRKQAAGAGTARENSSPEKDARLQAAIDAWNDVNTQIEESIAENVGRR